MDSFVTKNQGTQHPASGASARNSVGCLFLLPLLPLLLLVDLVGKTIIWGIASLFGVQMPALAITIKWMAYVIFIPLGAVIAAALIWMLFQSVLDFARKIFRKDKPPTEKSSTEIDS